MGDDQSSEPLGKTPASPANPPDTESAEDRSFWDVMKPRYEDDPPTHQQRGLPTWAWVILVIVLIIFGLPLLLIGGLYLFCLLSGSSF